MKSLKIIFLDVDGVLNCNSTQDSCGISIGIEDEKVSLLKTIVDQTNAKIVLVSTWKNWWFKEESMKENQDEYANYLDFKLLRYGLSIFDKTSNDIKSRGQGMLDYIKSLEEKTSILLILLSLMMNYLIIKKRSLLAILFKQVFMVEGCNGNTC